MSQFYSLELPNGSTRLLTFPAPPSLDELRSASDAVYAFDYGDILQIRFDAIGVFVDLGEDVPIPPSGALRVIRSLGPPHNAEPEAPNGVQNVGSDFMISPEQPTLDLFTFTPSGDLQSEAVSSPPSESAGGSVRWPDPFIAPDLPGLPCLLNKSKMVDEYEARSITDRLYTQVSDMLNSIVIIDAVRYRL
jgi:hypothetical protein